MRGGTTCPALRSSAATSKPLFPGSMTSRTTMSKCRSGERSKASAVSPSLDTSTLYPSASRLKRSPSARCFSSSTINTVVISSGPRKQDREGPAHPFPRAFGENSAAVPFDNGAHNEESEPGPLDLICDASRNPIKTFENALELSMGDAHSGVFDPDRQAPFIRYHNFD